MGKGARLTPGTCSQRRCFGEQLGAPPDTPGSRFLSPRTGADGWSSQKPPYSCSTGRAAVLLLITLRLHLHRCYTAITVELCFLITKLSLMHIIVGLCGYTNYRTASALD